MPGAFDCDFSSSTGVASRHSISVLSPNVTVASPDYKLILNYESQEAELYDLAADRGEQVNLAAQAPERMAELLASLTQRIEDNRLLRTALATDGHRKPTCSATQS